MSRVRTVAKDVLALLLEAGHVSCDVNDAASLASCLRVVQLYLVKLGFKRGRRHGKSTYGLSKVHVAARNAYVQHMATLAEGMTVVYLDESYIHHHYARHADSLHDPTDTAPLKEKHKGRRLCFIAGIYADGADSNLVGLDVFEGGTKRPTKDYHVMFNHEYFSRWFDALMDTMEALGKENVTFVMDNAKYHKSRHVSTPRGTWRKADLVAACGRFGVPVESHELKKVIWARLKPVVATSVEPVIVLRARDRGHDVVYTPPHHSDLQPIEMVWSKVKGDVGVQYTVDTTFADMRLRLDAAFAALPSAVILNCTHHCDNLLHGMYDLLLASEDVEAHTSDSSASGTSASDSETLDP